MNKREETWKRYSDAWHATDAERTEIFKATLAKQCVYTDPLATTTGWKALTEYMRAFQQQFPGARFAVQDFETHNDCSIAHWKMLAPDGSPISAGVSYGEFDESGKITKMTGFFDVPAQA
jgi:hypothetical protein